MYSHSYIVNPIQGNADYSLYDKHLRDLESWSIANKDEKIKEINNDFFEANSALSDNNEVRSIWTRVEKMLQENPALINFVLDYQCAKSRYFFPWLINVSRNPARAIELLYGEGDDLEGNWVTNIHDSTDQIANFIRNDPLAIYYRETQQRIAELSATLYDGGWSENGKKKIVVFNSGYMPWLNHYGFMVDTDFIEINAFDTDPFVHADYLTSLGVNFKHGNAISQMKNIDCKEADLIIYGPEYGNLDITPLRVFYDKIIKPAYHLLNLGGELIFDIKLNSPMIDYLQDVFCWPLVQQYQGLEETIADFERERRAIWKEGCKFSTEYFVDNNDREPTAVQIVMTKK